MKTAIAAIITITAVIITGCEEYTIVESQAPTVQELEAIVKGNSLTLIEAVEAFANDNNGYYPNNVDSDLSATGKALIDYLPGGERLINPFTGLNDQPLDSIPSSPGEIGYYKYLPHFNVYYVKGFGATTIIVEHDNIEVLEALVVADCLELQHAVEAWRRDFYEDTYPIDNSAWNDLGNTVSDYLPDGEMMENRFTKAPYEPRTWNSLPCGWGAIGYEYKMVDDIAVGYTITAVGFELDSFIVQININ